MSDEEETGFELLGLPTVRDSEGLRSRDPVEVLASQFVEELRAGERPSVESWARRYPPHAARIREYFPVLAMLEQSRLEREAATLRQHMPGKLPLKTLGGCEILCELGRGGMGVVYQARDMSSGHLVAIKVLPWRVTIVPAWQQRFEQEARTVARLKHRNIVPVFRFGQEQGYCFFVMQFVNGIGLDRLITRLTQTDAVSVADEIRLQQLSRPATFVAPPLIQSAEGQKRDRISRHAWNHFIRLGIQAAQALQHAHESGIIHNDVKPGNLLLDAQGRLWVTDFGVSQPLNAMLPADGPVAGTLRFMAPERLQRAGDVRSDLYSLGMSLYELCVQRPALEDPPTATTVNVRTYRPPPAPHRFSAGIPRNLEQTILNCLWPDPAHRYQSAQQLLTDLMKCASGQPVSATRPGVWSELWKSFRS